MVKIITCGGHFSPALAVIEKLRLKRNYQIFHLGRKYALEGDKALSLEYRVIAEKLSLPFYDISAGRLQRLLTPYTLLSLLKIPIGFMQSLLILRRLKPQLILSFGGYVALPICLSASLLKIPIITHEQTQVLGLANRIISRLAKLLCLSFPNTESVPAKVKTFLTGNPVRESIYAFKNKKIVNFGDKNLPLIYITGGSLGSRTINQMIETILPELLSHFRILHQCGNAQDGQDYERLLILKKKLPLTFRENYSPVRQIDPDDIGSILSRSSLVVSRAGANTVFELLTSGTPSLLIPLAWAADMEQEKNANFLKSSGLAEVIKQEDLTAKVLIKTISLMMRNLNIYKKNAERAKSILKIDAAKNICKLIESYL